MPIRHKTMSFPHRKKLQVDSCRPADLSALTTILLGGTPAICSNRLLWIQAVKDHFDDVPLFVSCRKLLQLVCETAPQVGYDVSLVGPDGCHQSGDLVAFCRGSTPFPSGGVHVFIRAKNALVSSSTVGGLGSEGDKTVLLGPKNWNPISSSKWTLLARHG